MEKSKNSSFGSKLGFILAAAGSAIGLGNIWRFPYLVGRYGGGAFVLVYILAVILLGSVVMIAEMYIGRRAKTNIVLSYNKSSKWLKWVGLLGVLVPFVISTYYAVIGGWASGYAVDFLFGHALGDVIKTTPGMTAGDFFGAFISDPLAIIFFILFLAATLLIVCGGVQGGIEKANKIMMPALFVLVVAVMIYGFTMKPSAGQTTVVIDGSTVGTYDNSVVGGLQFYMGSFNFEALGWRGTIAAMTQAFYSLSLGMGVMVSYGSYTGKNTNLGKSALTVCFLDTLVALLAGFAIFPAMFATGNGGNVGAGAGLLFISLSQVFSTMAGGNVVGFLFFTFVIFAALTSLMSLVEVVSQYTLEKYNWSRKKATLTFGGLIGLIGIFVCISQGYRGYNLFGFDLLTYFDEVTNNVLMPIIAFMGCITVGYVIKPKTVFKELEEMGSSFKGQKVWMALCMSVTPILLIVVFIMGVKGNWESYAAKDLNYGWVFGGSMLVMVLSWVWNFLQDNEKWQARKARKKEAEKIAVAAYQEDHEENEPPCAENVDACACDNNWNTCDCGCDCNKSEDATK